MAVDRLKEHVVSEPPRFGVMLLRVSEVDPRFVSEEISENVLAPGLSIAHTDGKHAQLGQGKHLLRFRKSIVIFVDP